MKITLNISDHECIGIKIMSKSNSKKVETINLFKYDMTQFIEEVKKIDIDQMKNRELNIEADYLVDNLKNRQKNCDTKNSSNKYQM